MDRSDAAFAVGHKAVPFVVSPQLRPIRFTIQPQIAALSCARPILRPIEDCGANAAPCIRAAHREPMKVRRLVLGHIRPDQSVVQLISKTRDGCVVEKYKPELSILDSRAKDLGLQLFQGPQGDVA